MRAQASFTYEIDFVPEPAQIFKFLQEKAGLPDSEAYYTWNMGLGYAIMAPEASVVEIQKIAEKHKIKSFRLGTVKKGEKKVIIKHKDIVFE